MDGESYLRVFLFQREMSLTRRIWRKEFRREKFFLMEHFIFAYPLFSGRNSENCYKTSWRNIDRTGGKIK